MNLYLAPCGTSRRLLPLHVEKHSPPLELLRGAGVDMATPDPIDDALGYFSQLIDELEGLVE